MTINEFKIKFEKIKAKGFIRSTRCGPTGVGHTLETYLRLNENNSPSSDIEGAEIKAHRSGGNNLITLFTFNNKAWKIPPLEAVRQYGSLDKNGRLGLYYTLSLKPNSAGLFLYVTDHEIAVRHISGDIIAVWQLETLAKRFLSKIPTLLFVQARTEERDGIEYFQFFRAQLMKGTNPSLLKNQFIQENILVDLRLHDKGTMARNHGTGFRTYENKLPFLFESIMEL